MLAGFPLALVRFVLFGFLRWLRTPQIGIAALPLALELLQAYAIGFCTGIAVLRSAFGLPALLPFQALAGVVPLRLRFHPAFFMVLPEFLAAGIARAFMPLRRALGLPLRRPLLHRLHGLVLLRLRGLSGLGLGLFRFWLGTLLALFLALVAVVPVISRVLRARMSRCTANSE